VGYAVVIGEALVDLLEARVGGEIVYRPAVGGAPLNVAVGLARLGGRVEFCGSVGADVFGRRIREYLRSAGVRDRGVVRVDVPTTLALTAFDGAEPDFHFYGQPPSYGLLAPEHLNLELVEHSDVLYCGSIALLEEPVLAAARSAWACDGPVRTFDPNIRPRLLKDRDATRAMVEEFCATADLVKLSAADARALYDTTPRAVADRLTNLGAGTVIVTLGADGALVARGEQFAVVAGVRVNAVDTTGAGDATMAALLAAILESGVPTDLQVGHRHPRGDAGGGGGL
jgi:fructokinase